MISVLIKDKLLLIFIALLAITLAAWALISFVDIDQKLLGAALLLMAFAKVQLVVTYYMEADEAPAFVHYAFNAWIWLVGLASVTFYWL